MILSSLYFCFNSTANIFWSSKLFLNIIFNMIDFFLFLI
uniref:Uncharacterized protein n=1 Tax=Myoviridae sp. ctCo31 TaxID=2825053 RepID=A0A8S5UM96_9CAUD|nr:MAG TPA: hypothetical protein [Myoviridae sp. ctCo31]